MFSQKECLVKNTLTILCVKIQEGHIPLAYLPTPMEAMVLLDSHLDKPMIPFMFIILL